MAVQETDGRQTAMRIDMNSDMGESFGRWTLGDDEALLDVVSSANVACGFHAGDPSVMLRTLSYAASRGVMVGAHVAYRDLAGFGRRYVDESPDELKADVMYQIVEYGGLDGVHMTNVATVDGLEPDRYFKQVGQLTDCARSWNPVPKAEGPALAAAPHVRRFRIGRRRHAPRFGRKPVRHARTPVAVLVSSPICGNIEPVRHNRGNGRKDSRKESRNDFLEPKEAP